MKKLLLTTAICLFANSALAQMQIEAAGKVNALYGYTEVDDKYKSGGDHNKFTGDTQVNFTARYDYDAEYSTSFHLDLMAAADHELEDYNQGKWGEEIYNITSTPYGNVMLGQTFNVASQFHTGAPSVGPLGINNSDIVDFISNPNWKRDGKVTKFATLNTTYINTDGVAPKITYVTPQYEGTTLGFTFVPDTYNRRGLINRHASYKSKEGYIVAAYNEFDVDTFSAISSLAYAYYNDNDQEVSGSISLTRANWTIGSGFRKTSSIGSGVSRNVSPDKPEYYDGFRDAWAWDIGVKYEFGPFKSSLSYFMSKAEKSSNEDKILMFANQYQYDKMIDLYAIVSHVDFEGQNHSKAENNTGYALVTGVGVNF